MIKSEWFYWLIGAVFLVMAAQMLTDRSNPKRRGTAAFWGLLGAGFIYGTWVVDKRAPAQPLGAAVLVMACLAGFGAIGRGVPDTTTPAERAAAALRFGSRLFVPALTIPVVAVLFAVVVKRWSIGSTPLLEKGSETIIGLGAGAIAGLLVALVVLRERRISAPIHAGRSLLEAMGVIMVLPQMLSTLGSIFQVAGVGDAVGRIISHLLPHGMTFVAVVVYCVGMAAFTVIMGNAFAAFPVMTAAVGWPVLVQHAGGNAAIVLAVGMLAGFSGTLCTPMAANFNIVPAALLELKDRYGPIKAQLPAAGVLLLFNIAVISLFAF